MAQKWTEEWIDSMLNDVFHRVRSCHSVRVTEEDILPVNQQLVSHKNDPKVTLDVSFLEHVTNQKQDKEIKTHQLVEHFEQDYHAALFFFEPFHTRFSQTVLELLFFHHLWEAHPKHAHLESSHESLYPEWAQLCESSGIPQATAGYSLTGYSSTTSSYLRDLIWCDSYSSRSGFLSLMATLAPEGTLIIQMNEVCDWLAEVTSLQPYFREIHITAATQSAFPEPIRFLVFKGMTKAPSDRLPYQHKVAVSIRDQYIQFYQKWRNKKQRNLQRIEYLREYPHHDPYIFARSEAYSKIREKWKHTWSPPELHPQPPEPPQSPDYVPATPDYEPPRSPDFRPLSPMGETEIKSE